MSLAVHSRRSVSATQKAPSTSPPLEVSGTPAYAAMVDCTRGIAASAGTARASGTMNGSPVATTNWHRESSRGIARSADASLGAQLSITSRESSMRFTNAIGTRSTRTARRVR